MGNGENPISFKLHMEINEINTTLLLEWHFWVFVITSDWDVDFGQMNKYVVSNILDAFYEEGTQLQRLWGVNKK